MAVQTKKSSQFGITVCPGCNNKFKTLNGAILSLPEECPFCQRAADPQDTPADNTLVMNHKSMAQMRAELANVSGRVRRLEADLKGVLGVLALDSTALNEDVPESTKAVASTARPDVETNRVHAGD
jgi:hypothetical protein